MYILKNALRNIIRSKGRTLLIGIIILVIAASSAITLAISNSAEAARTDGLSKIQVTGNIAVDREAVMAAATAAGTDPRAALAGVAEIPLSSLVEYGTLASVKEFYYTMTTSIDGDDALNEVSTAVETTVTTTIPTDPTKIPTGGGGGMGSQGDFSLVGVSSASALSDFSSGSSKLISGSMMAYDTSDRVAVISSELATLNGIGVGSVINLVNPNLDTETYSFTVVGIYENTETSTEGTIAFSSSTDPANKIYTSYNVINTMIAQSNAGAVVEIDEDTGLTTTTVLREETAGIYSFVDVAAYNSFVEELTAKGLPEFYQVNSTDLDSYEASLKPLEDLSRFAVVFLGVVLGIGSVILIVLNIFNIRERKYEVGVLTAIGMKKEKVALQFITEIFMVTFIFIVLGTGIGAAASVPTANLLLNNQVTETAEAAPTPTGTGRNSVAVPPVSVEDYVDQVNASVDIVVLGELIGIGFFLAIISSAVGIVFILRYEPLKILSERS